MADKTNNEHLPKPFFKVHTKIALTGIYCHERRIDNCTLVSAERPEDKEVFKYKQKLVTAQASLEAVFHYQDYEFDHEDKFGLRGYIYDIDSRGSAELKVCRV